MKCIECGSTNFDKDDYCLDCGRRYYEGDALTDLEMDELALEREAELMGETFEVDERHDPQGEWLLSPERLDVLTAADCFEDFRWRWIRDHLPDTGEHEDWEPASAFTSEEVFNPCNPANEDEDYIECTWED